LLLKPPAACSFPLGSARKTAALMLFAGEWIDAHEAVTAGLACRTCQPERVLDETMEVALNLAQQPLPRYKPRTPAAGCPVGSCDGRDGP